MFHGLRSRGTRTHARLLGLVVVVVAVAAGFAAFASADFVRNAAAANFIGTGGNVRVAPGGFVSIPYWIQATGPQSGGTNCDVSSSNPYTVNLPTMPAGITADKTSLTFTGCGDVGSDKGNPVYTGDVQYVTFTVGSDVADGTKFDIGEVTDDGTIGTNVTAFKITATSPGSQPPGDTTGPTITYTLSPPANGNGWNNSDVTITWTISDDSGIDHLTSPPSGCGTYDDTLSTATTDIWEDTVSGNTPVAGVTRTCSAYDTEGNSSSTTTSPIKIDTDDPTATYALDPTSPNGFGWYNHVSIAWTTGDALSGLDTGLTSGCTNGAITTEATPDGLGGFTGVTPSCSVTDLASNNTTTTVSPQILLDTHAPVVTLDGPSNGGTYSTGAGNPAPSCSTTDALSGVQTAASLLVTGLNGNGVGNATGTCSGALDKADNPGNVDTKSWTVNYGVVFGPGGCILEPINCDNSSVFSRGKSIPVKFRLNGDEPNGFSTTGWTVYKMKQATCTIDSSTVNETQSTSNSSSGLRYDPTADQYVYNADFRTEQVGTCWKMKVVLDDPNHTPLQSAVFKITK